jgi:hypothetical protein
MGQGAALQKLALDDPSKAGATTSFSKEGSARKHSANSGWWWKRRRLLRLADFYEHVADRIEQQLHMEATLERQQDSEVTAE